VIEKCSEFKIYQDKNQLINNLVADALEEVLGQKVIIETENSLGGGCINHASKLETSAGNFFLKWNDNCATDIFIREAESLRELKKAAGELLVIPEVFAAKLVDETPGFLVLEFLESGFFTNSDEKLGRGLANIHQFTNANSDFTTTIIAVPRFKTIPGKITGLSFFVKTGFNFC
jgi:protein-ribulosamine 3-kinase